MCVVISKLIEENKRLMRVTGSRQTDRETTLTVNRIDNDGVSVHFAVIWGCDNSG